MPVEIFDTQCTPFKVRKVENIRVARYEMPSEEDGTMVSVKCVEFIVVGENRKWKHWIPYEDFVRANGHIEVEE